MGEIMLRNKRLLRRTAVLAATATALVSLAACGSGLGDSGKSRKGKGRSDSAASDTSKSKKKSKSEAGGLELGDTASEPVPITLSNKTGEFEVTMEKVVVGKPGDLDQLNGDEGEYDGKVPAWLYATYEHVGGDSPAEISSTDLGMTMEGGDRARPLIVIGRLSATPEDCVGSNAVGAVKAGERATICQVFIVPEGEAVDEALLSRGFSAPPTEWDVD